MAELEDLKITKRRDDLEKAELEAKLDALQESFDQYKEEVGKL